MAFSPVRRKQGVSAVNGKEGHRAWAVLGHSGHMRVGGIQDCHAVRCHVLDNNALDDRQILNRLDVVQPRWTPTPTLVTTAILLRSKPTLRQYARLVLFEDGCVHIRRLSTLRALRGPLQSPVSMHSPLM